MIMNLILATLFFLLGIRCLISGATTLTQMQAAVFAGWQRWGDAFHPERLGPNPQIILSETRQFELWRSQNFTIRDVTIFLQNLDVMYQKVSNSGLGYRSRISFLSKLQVNREWLVSTLKTMKRNEATRKIVRNQIHYER